MLTIYAVNDQGEKIKKGEIPITNDGTFGDSKELLKILEMYLVSLGIEQASEVLLLADGADWIWKNIPPLLESKGCPRSTTYYLQDFYHVTEHLADFAEVAFQSEKEKQKWFKKACSWLKRGKIRDFAFRDDHAPKADSLPTPLPTNQGN